LVAQPNFIRILRHISQALMVVQTVCTAIVHWTGLHSTPPVIT
jgi:hypothetical protein